MPINRAHLLGNIAALGAWAEHLEAEHFPLTGQTAAPVFDDYRAATARILEAVQALRALAQTHPETE